MKSKVVLLLFNYLKGKFHMILLSVHCSVVVAKGCPLFTSIRRSQMFQTRAGVKLTYSHSDVFAYHIAQKLPSILFVTVGR